ncbi:DUF2835 domain-containing protein [Vibrio sp.]|uniref:DUF2835 domain-containing protein n=1 Tax=Vibrio sp. TaxID=678 RepID=UPI003D13DB76
MNYYYFRINITYQQFLAHYSGVASTLIIQTECGLKLQIAAVKFRPFLTQLGLKGRYRLSTDQNNKFIQLEAL